MSAINVQALMSGDDSSKKEAARQRGELRQRKRREMLDQLTAMQQTFVAAPFEVRSYGGGMAYRLVVKDESTLGKLPRRRDASEYLLVALHAFLETTTLTRLGFTVRPHADGKSIVLTQWEEVLDRKWRRLWSGPPSNDRVARARNLLLSNARNIVISTAKARGCS